MLQIVWYGPRTSQIVSICWPSEPRPLTVPTAGLVFSAHAHKLPGRDCQTYAYNAVLGDICNKVCSADAKGAWGMCSVEL